jgi:protein-S-isoprenylcysteine O-methyltransferase Ste14
VTSGPFAFVRRLRHVGALVGLVGAVMGYRTWALVFILLHVPVCCVRAQREAAALGAEFGAARAGYCRRVPAGVPLHVRLGHRRERARHSA